MLDTPSNRTTIDGIILLGSVAIILGIILSTACKGSNLTIGARQERGLEYAAYSDRNTGDTSSASSDGSEIFGYAELTFQLTPQEIVITNPPALVPIHQPAPIEAPTGLADVAKEVVQADVWTIIALSVLGISAALCWYLFGGKRNA